MAEGTRARRVVIAAASRHGSTADIAARIEHTVREHLSSAWVVETVDVSDLRSFEDADAVVLGSAVYLGRWLRPAVKALHFLKDQTLLDLWLFSSGPVSDDVVENRNVITADELVETGDATDHMVFAGRLDPSRLAWWERRAVRIVGAVAGDRRDWAAIDDWAIGIASRLTAAEATTERRS